MTMFYVLASACSEIPCPVFQIAHIVVLLIKYAVPVILIVLGMLDFAKASMQQNDDDIAKAKNVFFRRLISGMCVFLVMVILELVFNILAGSAKNNGGEDGSSVWDCAKLIFSGTVNAGSGQCDENPFE